MSCMSRTAQIVYSMAWYLLYLTCFYIDESAKSSETDNFAKICLIGKTWFSVISMKTFLFYLILGIKIHTVLGFFMCSIAYAAFVLKTNNLYHLVTRFKQVDTLLFQITGMKYNFRNYSNRFQLNLLLNGVILYITLTALDTTIFEM